MSLLSKFTSTVTSPYPMRELSTQGYLAVFSRVTGSEPEVVRKPEYNDIVLTTAQKAKMAGYIGSFVSLNPLAAVKKTTGGKVIQGVTDVHINGLRSVILSVAVKKGWPVILAYTVLVGFLTYKLIKR